MFLKLPGAGEVPAPMRPARAAKDRLQSGLRRLGLALLPLLLLGSLACGGKSDETTAPGTPPTLTSAPSSTSTVTGRVVTFTVSATGAPTLRYQWFKDGVTILGALSSSYTLYNPKLQDAGKYTVTVTNPNGSVTSDAATLTVTQAVNFGAAVAVVVDASGNAYVSDMDDHTVWKVSPTYQKTLLAGASGLPGSADGPGANARFNTPGGLALDASGNLLVADTGNHTLRRIATDGTVTTLAGSPGQPGSTDGASALARFNGPFGLAVAATGAIYISDTQNHTIRLLATDGTVSTYAGLAQKAGQVDGDRASARFNQPNGLALTAGGTLYVADFGNSVIRAISAGGTVSLLAGQYNTLGWLDGTGTAALFRLPVAIVADASGNLYVADASNHAIRRVTSAGVVSVLAGSGSLGNVDSTGSSAQFYLPCGLALTPAGNLLVADTNNRMLRSLSPAGVVTTPTVP